MNQIDKNLVETLVRLLDLHYDIENKKLLCLLEATQYIVQRKNKETKNETKNLRTV